MSDADIEALGIECAQAARDAAGPDPTDDTGLSLLPIAPLPDDYAWAERRLGRPMSGGEMAAFGNAYVAERLRMRKEG